MCNCVTKPTVLDRVTDATQVGAQACSGMRRYVATAAGCAALLALVALMGTPRFAKMTRDGRRVVNLAGDSQVTINVADGLYGGEADADSAHAFEYPLATAVDPNWNENVPVCERTFLLHAGGGRELCCVSQQRFIKSAACSELFSPSERPQVCGITTGAICEGIVTTKVARWEIVYSARDSSKNRANDVTVTVNYVDTTPPALVVSQAVVHAEACSEWTASSTAQLAFARDAVDGTIDATTTSIMYSPSAVTLSSTCSTTGVHVDEISTSVLGSYCVTFLAVDSEGNTATDSLVVIVRDSTPPTVTVDAQQSTTFQCGNNELTADKRARILAHVSTSDAACVAGPTLSAKGLSAIDTNVVATYSVEFTATDAVGLSSSITQTFAVVDTAPPTIDCGGVVQIFSGEALAPAQCHVSDACTSGLVAVANQGTLVTNTDALGVFDEHYTVTDGAGLSATGTRQVMIVARPTAEPTSAPTLAPTAVPTSHPTHHVCDETDQTIHPCDATHGVCDKTGPGPTEHVCRCQQGFVCADPQLCSVCDVETNAPTHEPTAQPSVAPTKLPTRAPTDAPTDRPTESPTTQPTTEPTTSEPTLAPTAVPTPHPTHHVCDETDQTIHPCDAKNGVCDKTGPGPTEHVCRCQQGFVCADGDVACRVCDVETSAPTMDPTAHPTVAPTAHPSESPTQHPTQDPTRAPVTPEKPVCALLGAAVITVEHCSTDAIAMQTFASSDPGALCAAVNDPNFKDGKTVYAEASLVIDSTKVADYKVSYTVVGSSGLTSDPVVRTVHVVDTEPPVISILAPPSASGAACTSADGLPCANIFVQAATDASATFALYEPTVADTCSQPISATFVVRATAIAQNDDATKYYCGHTNGAAAATAAAAEATNAQSLVPLERKCSSYTVIYDAVDASGNKASLLVPYTIADTAPPCIGVHASTIGCASTAAAMTMDLSLQQAPVISVK